MTIFRRLWNWLTAAPPEVERSHLTVTASLLQSYYAWGKRDGWRLGTIQERERILREIDEWIEANRACEVQYLQAGDSDLARIYHERVEALRQMRGEIEVIVK